MNMVTDPTLFVTATTPAEGVFSGAPAVLAIPSVPFVALGNPYEASNGDPFPLLCPR